MAKKNYLKIEYTVTLLVIIAVVLMIIPFDFDNEAQADFISRWQDKYSRLEYMFSVISAHEKEEILKSFQRAKTADEREQLMINLIQPYFRIHKQELPRRYVPKFMNKISVPASSKYYFTDTYSSENGMIVGIKAASAYLACVCRYFPGEIERFLLIAQLPGRGDTTQPFKELREFARREAAGYALGKAGSDLKFVQGGVDAFTGLASQGNIGVETKFVVGAFKPYIFEHPARRAEVETRG